MGKHEEKPKPGTPNPQGDGQHPPGKPLPPKLDPGKHDKK